MSDFFFFFKEAGMSDINSLLSINIQGSLKKNEGTIFFFYPRLELEVQIPQGIYKDKISNGTNSFM